MYKNLYDSFKHWYDLGGTVYFYSDPHFADAEMQFLRTNYVGDEEQIKKINSKVTKKDTLVILGDIGDYSWVKKIKAGYKVLLLGNHDMGAEKFKRVQVDKEIDIEDYLGDLTPNQIALKMSLEEQELYYEQARKKAILDLKQTESFIDIPKNIYYDFHKPFMFWIAHYDNKLFDEVYEGTLQISPKIILSHEPIDYKYCFNIHGHDHSNWYKNDQSLNVCAEHIDYTPISIKSIISSGKLKDIPDIHRDTIDSATSKKKSRLAKGEIR